MPQSGLRRREIRPERKVERKLTVGGGRSFPSPLLPQAFREGREEGPWPLEQEGAVGGRGRPWAAVGTRGRPGHAV